MISGKYLLDTPDNPTEQEQRDAIDGLRHSDERQRRCSR